MRYLTLSIFALGLLASCAGGGTGGNTAGTGAQSSLDGKKHGKDHPEQYTGRVVKVYPHSTLSYTQGLFWYDGYLYEGTGLNGKSALMKVELKSGVSKADVNLPAEYFGEGITLHGEKIYQLTWRNGVALVYDLKTLRKLGEKRYSGEGWGITSDGEKLYMSDGSDKIYTVDPETFNRTAAVNVTMNGNRVHYLNELEWIDGEIWANVYMSDLVVRINPETGKVKSVVDLSGLLSDADRTTDTDVLNGIAYDHERKRIFVTGKNWNKLFEIEIIER